MFITVKIVMMKMAMQILIIVHAIRF